jgi:KDO2-lipid IV(A) lauroyltransferase
MSRILLGVLWCFHWLPLPLQAACGQAIGALLYRAARSRRRVALRNLALCFRDMPPAQRRQLARQHFGFVTRSLLERGLLWYASPARLRRLITVEGDVGLADRSERPVMWLVPHFVGLDIAGVACMLYVQKRFASIYQKQSNETMDAAIRRGRLRFGKCEIFPRSDSVKPLLRCIRQGMPFFNLPDMDFGARDAEFVPFFGVRASTLTAPSRIARAERMIVQPVIAEMKADGSGYVVRFLPALDHFPTDDPVHDAATMNRMIEQEVEKMPAQYLWVHKRFKTRPSGETSLYDY